MDFSEYLRIKKITAQADPHPKGRVITAFATDVIF